MNRIIFKGFILFTLIVSICASCNWGTKVPDVSHIQINVTPKMFFIDLFQMDEDKLEEETRRLHQQYGSYLDAYSQQIIKIGNPESADYASHMRRFINYEDNKEVYSKCIELYPDSTVLKDALTNAFKYYKYYFPEAQVPEVYFHTSYFNQSIAMDSTWVSVSVEKYLGEDCEFYEWLSIPKYLRKKMVPQKVVPDIMKALAMSNHTIAMKNEDVLSKMISQAKLQYFIKTMIPTIEDTLLFDYTKNQMKWCERYEADIWASMVEQKHLYNNERMIMQKYVGDSPFTYYFGQDSPGKAAVFLGLKIIEAYMKNNPGLSLADLLMQADAHLILREARYRP